MSLNKLNNLRNDDVMGGAKCTTRARTPILYATNAFLPPDVNSQAELVPWPQAICAVGSEKIYVELHLSSFVIMEGKAGPQ
jgi:hypothetical protein